MHEQVVEHPAARPAACIVLLILMAVASGCSSQSPVRKLMPTPAIFLVPAARAVFDEVPESRRRDYVDLLYITDRAPNTTPQADLPYGQQRSRYLSFGSAKVALLPPMSWSALTRHSLAHPRDSDIELSLKDVEELGRYPTEPYALQAIPGGVERDPIVLEQHDRSEAILKADVERRLASAPTGEVMLYVHGFNETFATAAYTAAELCHFVGRAHVCAFFTWPASSSGMPLLSYTQTTESAQYSVGHLKKAIRALATTPGVTGIQLLAHSRGTAVLLYAYRELALEAVAAGEDPAEAFKIENIVLMSPDIDADVALQQLEIFASDPGLTTHWQGPKLPRFVRKRMTIYSSPRDKALKLSQLLFRGDSRVGQLTPEDLTPNLQSNLGKTGKIDLIVYEGKRTDKYGHSYFTSNPRVSADLIELIRNDTGPGEPGRPLVRNGKIVWVFPDR